MPMIFDEPVAISDAERAECRAMIREGSKTFYAASFLLPERVRTPAYALYAFCRLSDDAVDAPDARADAVNDLRARLNRIYDGAPAPHAVDRSFAEAVARFAMPFALPDALLDGLSWDTDGRRYDTISDLHAYSARVAGTVGAMMTVLMGVRNRDTLARACDLGVAMQLTNIARDVGEDARNGRIYLPLDWLAEAGVDVEAFLARPQIDYRLRGVIKRVLDTADDLYARSAGGIAGLPLDCRPAIHAARLIYREIGRELARADYDSVSSRAVVSSRRKLALLGAACAAASVTSRSAARPALEETAFLVQSVPPGVDPPKQRFVAELDRRVGRVLEIFDHMDARTDGTYGGRDVGPAQ